MNDIQEIKNLIFSYAEQLDLGNLSSVAEIFVKGEIYAPATDSTIKGKENIFKMYEDSCRIYEETGTPCTKHITTNIIVNIDSEAGTANSRSYYTVIQATQDFPLQPIIAGRYHDTFIQEDGKWYFLKRVMFVDLMGDCGAHLLIDQNF